MGRELVSKAKECRGIAMGNRARKSFTRKSIECGNIGENRAQALRQDSLARGVGVVEHGVSVLMQMAHMMDEEFALAAERIAGTRGGVVVCGIGKAGLIGRKVAATFSSTGTRAHFLHPSEALHGDLGSIGPNDIVLVLSNSGASTEVVDLLPYLARRSASVIAITSRINSPLALAADITLLTPVCTEACRYNLAPTTSTLAMLALGDALALVVSELKNFREEDFAELHPGGALGRRLASVDEVMRPLDECRLCHESLSIRQMLVETSRPGRRTGAVMIENDAHELVGIFTDSDLTRFLGQSGGQIGSQAVGREVVGYTDLDRPLREVMTSRFSAIRSGARLTEAIEILSHRKISELPVVNGVDQPVGLIDITDVISSGAWAGSLERQGEVCTELGGLGEVGVSGHPHLRIFGSTL